MNHFASSLIWYLLGGLLLLTACRKESVQPPALLGTWTESFNGSPQGHFVNQLTFNADHTFSWKVNNYGAYPGQGATELSAWTEFRGKVVQQENTLVFTSRETTWWDKFYPGMEPKTEKTSQPLFDDCSFTRSGKRLELVYTSYPADAPVSTRKTFYKLD
jgi:hypothetical protein